MAKHIPFQDAMAMVPDDMPDGAFWALAEEFAGLEPGEAVYALLDDDDDDDEPPVPVKKYGCSCGKQFATRRDRYQHRRAKGHR